MYRNNWFFVKTEEWEVDSDKYSGDYLCPCEEKKLFHLCNLKKNARLVLHVLGSSSAKERVFDKYVLALTRI